jgi:hypothetical protein
VRGGAGSLIVVLGCLQRPQRVVPAGLQRVGDRPVVGVDGEVSAAGELGVLAGPLDV